MLDATLKWSRYIGGVQTDSCNAVATDQQGNIYLTGGTNSVDFPVSANALQKVIRSAPMVGGLGLDAFVLKISPTGDIVYATFLGGDGGDAGQDIAVDDEGNAFVTGSTTSSDFPTSSPFQPTRPGAADQFSVFVAKLNPSGSKLLYSTYLGGAGNTVGNGIAVDAAGSAYVVGQTDAPDFPTTHALQPAFGGGPRGDAFVAKLAPGGDSLAYATYLGGGDEDVANAVALDTDGHAFVTGFTASEDFPVTPDAYQKHPGLVGDETDPDDYVRSSAFVAKLAPDGDSLVYATYFGRELHDGRGIAVGSDGGVIICGRKASTLVLPRFPEDPKPYLAGFGGVFVAKLNAGGTPVYHNDLAPGDHTGAAIARAVAIDSSGRACVTGLDVVQNTADVYAFLAILDHAGQRQLTTTLGAPTQLESGTGVALGPGDEVYVTGWTDRADLRDAPALATGVGTQNGFVTCYTAADTAGLDLTVTRVIPNRAADTGSTSTVVYGSGISSIATVSLSREGTSPIGGRHVHVASDGTQLRATFDLDGAAQGEWDVVVRNPDGAEATLPDGVVLEATRPAELSVDIVGAEQIRVGRSSTFTVVVDNRWNRDALLVPLCIDGIPADAEVSLGVDLAAVQPGQDGNRLLADQASPVVDRKRDKVISLAVPVARAGAAVSIPIHVTPASLGAFDLRAYINEPLAQSDVKDASWGCVLAAAGSYGELQQILAMADPTCLNIARKFFFNTMFDAWEQNYKIVKNEDWKLLFLTWAQVLSGAIEVVLRCALPESEGAELIEKVTIQLSLINAFLACSDFDDDHAKDETKKTVKSRKSIDPNEKVGPNGAGAGRFVPAESNMAYAISFENLATATAPAQEVVITDQLDAEAIDLDTFAFGDITFGEERISALRDRREITSEVDLRPANDLIVRCTGKLDSAGLVTWRFRSIDPASGGPPDEPLAGFLPPNHNPPEGAGSVFFTCRLRPDLPSGKEIRNSAQIVFDANPPIVTNEWINTVDSAPPQSHVEPLAPQQSSPRFAVKWSASDPDSGPSSYTSFVSTDGGLFEPWVRNTRATSELFQGEEGRTYAFYCLATDAAGNLERREARADTMTRVKARIGRHRAATFEIYADAADEYRWRLVASNGQIIATSGEGFASKANALRAAIKVRDGAGRAEIANDDN